MDECEENVGYGIVLTCTNVTFKKWCKTYVLIFRVNGKIKSARDSHCWKLQGNRMRNYEHFWSEEEKLQFFGGGGRCSSSSSSTTITTTTSDG